MDLCKKIFFIFLFIFFIFLSNKCFALTFTYNGNEYTCKDPPVVNKPYQVVALQYRKDTNVWYKSFYYCDYPIGIYHNGSEWGFAVGDYNTNHTQGSYYYNTSGLNSGYGNTILNFITGTFNPVSSTKYQEPVFYANYELRLFNNYTDIQNNYSGSNSSVIVPLPENYDNLPYFLNDPTDIAYGGYNIVVMPGDFPNSKEIVFTLEENNPVEVGAGGIQDVWTTKFALSLTAESQFYYAIDNTGVGFYYVIPWNYIMRYLTLTKEYRYSLSYTINGDTEGSSLVVTYGGGSVDDAIYNAGVQQTIQQQETTQAIENQTQAIEEQTQAIDNINDTLTDDTITSSASDLPSVSVSDPSQNGIDNIFQSIYNAFCTGQAQNIVFPIPFTNKNITLNPYYVRDMLNNNGASWIYTLIQAFWGYLIGRYIVKDVSKKITKIKGGNIENLENENIKEDML